MFFRLLTIIIVSLLAASSCLAQGIFLDKGESAPLIDFGFATGKDTYLFGLSVGYSAGGVFDFGGGGLYGGDGSTSVAGGSQFAAIHFLRFVDPQGSRFSLSLMQSLVSVSSLGNSYYGATTTTLSVGGRATLQFGRSSTAVAPFIGYARAGLAAEGQQDMDVYEYGLVIVSFARRSVFAFTPAVSTGGGTTSFSISLTLNMLGTGGASSSGGKWKDGGSFE